MPTPTIGELLARLEEQQARIDRLESRSAAPPAGGAADDPAGPGPRPAGMTRRGMVAAAAAGTAGIVGAVLAESAGVASAATGGPASFKSSSATPAVTATNTAQGYGILAAAGSAAAVRANQSGTAATDIAVKGVINNTTGTGTGVQGTSPQGTGVSGSSTGGTGVAGSSNTGTGVTGSSGSTASNASAVLGTIASTAPGGFSSGVRGTNNGTGGTGVGVYGSHGGSGYGVYGFAPSGTGVVGQSDDSAGVHGTAAAGGYGVLGDTVDGNGYGVYGDASQGTGVFGATASGTGVEGSATGGVGVRGASTSGYGVYGTSSSNYGVVGLTTSGNGVYGQVSAASQAGVVGRQEDASGNWAVYGFGNIGATGTKSAVVPAEDGGAHLTLYCMESPECWFEDFGAARLSGGSAAIRIDPEFAQTIHTGEYHMFVQAEGECRGLFVRDKTATGFVVQELGGGTSSTSFAYRIVARRKDVTAPRLRRVTLPEAPEHKAAPPSEPAPAPKPATQAQAG